MQMMQPVRLHEAVHAEKLAFLSDIEGVYKDPKMIRVLDLRACMYTKQKN